MKVVAVEVTRAVMKQISGCVLVKSTNSGIPNLIVTAYDSERSAQDGRQGNGRPSHEDLGKRIGSVLTDADGRFVLTGEDLEFQGNESRPDLLIVISAPEDVQGLDMPYPLPPERRILYISAVPREDAGAEEAFVIRLLQDQLDHFHLTANTSTSHNSMDDHRFATALEEAWDSRDRLRDRLGPRLRAEQEKNDELQSMAEEKVKNLSAIPHHLRNDDLINSTLLINGKANLGDNLHTMQKHVVANGIDRLKDRRAVIHLRLTKSELEDLGLNMADGALVGDIDVKKLTATVRAKIDGFDLVRKRGLNNPQPEDLIKKYLLEDHPAHVDSKHPPQER